ncbi:rod shape-determining protein MreD [Aureivirga sp. CE67]|uniref:rod shape-determining protein MreD n=1 Tax=Aureivirga sp. CE67 TaxID=1788983 RepID=UPI0018CB15A3|nr:rod shape-determining protein MreD [Aureivirga sp. CE67]
MNNLIISNVLRFFVLILLQVLVFNSFNFLGFINPAIYILFIILFPIRRERTVVLVSSFLLGLFIDFFSNSGGVNAAAMLLIAYLRIYIIKFIHGSREYDYALFNPRNLAIGKLISYVGILTFIHQFTFYLLSNFTFHNFLDTLFKVIVSSIVTTILLVFSVLLFEKKK